jgi:photosystem II stability/assembly factor-like uncharacterized protein
MDAFAPESEGFLSNLLDAANGWLVTSGYGGQILSTQDGGASWALEYTADPTVVLSAIHFTDVDHGWAVGSNGTVLQFQRTLAAPVPALSVTLLATLAALLGLIAVATLGTRRPG